MHRQLALSWFVAAVACGGAAPTGEQPIAPSPAVVVAPVAPVAPSPEAERHYQRALELEATGRHAEAKAEVELALASGAGRDATLLAGKLAILRDDLDEAARLLTPLAKDGGDALVLYNLGLVAQKRGRYNDARNGYLGALQVDPGYAPARFNLAVLTWEAGAKDEAQHHARKFLAAAPDDPRGEELRALILAEPAAP
jgi:tetratricopeptide (TPR) repeat protein